jgi:hypothetical protein
MRQASILIILLASLLALAADKNKVVLKPHPTEKAPRLPATPCQELTARLGIKSLKSLTGLDLLAISDDSLTYENLDNVGECILSSRLTLAERQAALTLYMNLLTRMVQKNMRDQERNKAKDSDDDLLKCADELNKYKAIAEQNPSQFTSDEFQHATGRCFVMVAQGMTEARLRAFLALTGSEDAQHKALGESFDKLNKAWVSEYQAQIKKYNGLVDDYNDLLQRHKNLADLAYQMSHRPAFLWSPPPPPKEIHCNTSGTINTYGSTTITANTHCTEY